MESVTSLNNYTIHYGYVTTPIINYSWNYQYTLNICPFCGSSSIYEKEGLSSGGLWGCSDCGKDFTSPIVLTYLNNNYSYNCGKECDPCPYKLPCSCGCCPWNRK